jgi:membrane protein insertase Oxa1/YidC/SpoIIIJ
VLRGLTGHTDEKGFFVPSYLSHDSELYKALRHSKQMLSWGMDLSHSAASVLQDDGIGKALPFLVLVGLTAVTAWYQQKQIQGRNMNRQTDMPAQQQMLMKFLPFMLTFFSFSMPAGVVVYFVVSSAVRIGQQAIVTRLEFGPDKGTNSPNGAKPKAPVPSAPKATISPRPASPQNRSKNKKKRK